MSLGETRRPCEHQLNPLVVPGRLSLARVKATEVVVMDLKLAQSSE